MGGAQPPVAQIVRVEIGMFRLYWRIVVRPYRWKIALIGVGTLLAGVAEIAGVALVIPVVALFLGGESASGNKFIPVLEFAARALNVAPTSTTLLFVALGGVFLFILLKSVLALGLNYLTAVVAKEAQRDLTRRLYLSFGGAPYLDLLSRGTGDTVETIRRPPDMVNYVIYQAGLAVAAAGQLLMTLAFLAWLAPTLMLVAGGLGGGIIIGFWLILKKQRAELGHRSLVLDQRKMGLLVETFGGIRDVKVLNLLPRLSERLDAFLVEHMAVEVRSLQYDQLPKIVFELAGLLILVLLIGLSLAVPAFRLEFPVMAAIVLAIRQMTPAVSTLSTTIMKAVQESRQLEIIEEALTTLTAENGRAGAQPLPRVVQALTLDAVKFVYPNQEVFRDLSATFQRGRMTAIVGRSKVGKTTLVNLLVRLQDVMGGTITADGTDIRRFSLPEWRARIGYVGQEPVLFNASVRENIAALEEGVAMEDIEKAARLAQIHEDIMALPMGYDTRVEDRGANFSGGQRQRIAIARALLKKPQILILDEATSALDNLTERALHEAIEFIRHEAIVIVIAHRLSTVEDADEILVLQDGRVAERGTHGALLARRGAYWQLYNVAPEPSPVTAEPAPVPPERA